MKNRSMLQILGSTDHGFPVSVKTRVGLKQIGGRSRLGFEYNIVVVSSTPIEDNSMKESAYRVR